MLNGAAMLPAALGALAGYADGSAVALALDALYTGAPVRGSLAHYAKRDLTVGVWAGSVAYVLARSRPPESRLPARFGYLPVGGSVAGLAIALLAVNARHALLLALFSTVLFALAAADFERHLLPNRLMVPALAGGVLLGWAWPGRTWLGTLEGGAIAGAVMLALFLALPKLGFGDVKLAALLGLLTGASHALFALALGMVAGGVGAVVLFLCGRARRGSLIAYGPYLALGAFAGMLLR